MALPDVFDRARVRRHLERRAPDRDDFVTRLVREDLDERLLAVLRTFEAALVMGPDPAVLPSSGTTAAGSFAFERVSTLLPVDGIALVDPEALVLPRDDYDLVVSLLDLQVINDVPGFLARVRAHLRPDGLFMAAALGGDTLRELRDAFLAADTEVNGGAFGRVAPFIPLSDAGGLLQRAGFALPVADVETHVVRYGSALRLMRELKSLGAQNPLRGRAPATARLLGLAATNYADGPDADADGRIRATLEIVWMSGWVPHQSQQQPARRGSGRVSLKDVLEKKP